MGFVSPASPGWGLGWVCLGTVCGVVPLVSAVCGVRGWGSVLACFFGRVWLRGRPTCPSPFPVPACGVGVCALPGSRLYPAFPGWVVGVCFLPFFFCGGPCRGPSGPCPPIPYLSGWAAGSFFFSWCVSACCGVPFPRGPLFLAWCCRFLLPGPPVPLWGSCLRCLLGGCFGRLWWCGRAVWWLWAVFAPPPLPPLLFFFGGGAAYSSLCFPWAGARTGPHSVLSSGLLLSVACCFAVFRPHGWAMYTLGSAPLLAGLGPGSAGWAAAPGGCLWLWVKGLGLFVSFPLCGAGFNLLGRLPPLLPGALWPRVWPAVLVCGVLVRRLPGCVVACFG